MRYLGIHLTREVKDLYPKNYRTHLKEIEEDTKRWKTTPCSWIGRIHILGKCPRDPGQFTHGTQSLSSEISRALFRELEQIIGRLVWNQKRPQMARAILEKKTTAGGITMPDFRLCYKPVLIKTVWYRHKNRHTDQWDRREKSRSGPSTLLSRPYIRPSRKDHPLEKRQSLH